MTSKELVKRVLERKKVDRLAVDFNAPNESDILAVSPVKLFHKERQKFAEWGDYPELKEQAHHFNGELNMNPFGNIYGRLEGKTKGECVKGALQDSWSLLGDYKLPEIDRGYQKDLVSRNFESCEKFVLGYLPISIFSIFRDLRLMDNALMDTMLEKENVNRLLRMIDDLGAKIIENAAAALIDGLIMFDDWGTQISTFISPQSFRELFKPYYKSFSDKCHAHGIKFIVHSCGMIHPIIKDFSDAGVDAMQFDQPEIYGSQSLVEEFGDELSFYCPVDIQKVMATGDKWLIEKSCKQMIEAFIDNGGGLIIKDYPTWQDIDIKDEWAQWARDIAYTYR